VVATDGPLDARQLRRLAFRALAGMARTGASFSHGSGDYVIAFSTAESVRIPHRSASATLTSTLLREDKLSPLFQAVAEATEEAIYNSLLQATTVRGHQGHEAQAIPVEDVKRLLKEHGRSARLMPNRPCRSRQLVLAKKVMWLPDSCGCIETQGNGTRGIGKVSVLTCVGCIRPAKQRLASELSAEFVRPEADLVSYDQLRGKGSRSHPQTRAKNRFFNDPPLCSTGRFQHPASVNPRAGRSIDELNGCSCKKAEREEKHNLQEPVQLGPCVSPPLHRCRFLEKDKDRSADHGDAYERQYVVHRRAPPLKPVAQ
ncbi:MAG: P1 family peptidase, partial [Candidatus Acidiferrales bacterium]